MIHERETGNGNMKRIDKKMKKSKDLAAKILIIDDEEPNVIFLETLLEEAGYTNVFSITDSREAVSWFRKVQPDILLLDLTMPYLNGFEVMERLALEYPEDSVPILVLTADATRSSKHLALKNGAVDYLSKPLDTVEVLLRISNHLELRSGRLLLEERVREQTAALERTTEELASAQRDASDAWQVKDRFLANMSHEIRTPINGIVGLCSLLAEEADSEELSIKLNLVVASCQQLAGFMDDVLDNSSEESSESAKPLDEIRLWELVQDSIALHEPLIALKELVVVVNEPDGGIPIFWSRESMLRQAVAVVVAHSVKHTEIGSIHIDLGWERLDEGIKVTILVRDSSLGAISVTSQALRAAGKADRAFDLPNELDLGFGLPTARRCLERIGGILEISSSPAVGSQYLISLQTQEGSNANKDTTDAEAPKCLNVLLVEDTKLNALVARALMERLGWTVTHVNNGAEAIEAFPLLDYALVLMDIQMPVMGGVEAASEIRKIANARGILTEVVAFTANASPDDIVLYESAGMAHLLQKPVTIDNVRELLHTLGLDF